jgi:hypothetical protein
MAGARLASWTMYDGTRRGSALILGGAEPFTLGGLGHSGGAPTDQITRVDAYLSSHDFGALLAAGPLAGGPVAFGPVGPAAPSTLRCSLAAGPAVFSTILPWLATMAIVAGLAVARDALTRVLGDPGVWSAIAIGAVFVTGLAATFVLWARRTRPPQAWLHLDMQGVRVSDRAGRVLLEAPLQHIVARPMRCTFRGRMTIVMPVLALSAPGFADVTVGVNELVDWPDSVPPCGSPRFVIGGADWADLLVHVRRRILVGSSIGTSRS